MQHGVAVVDFTSLRYNAMLTHNCMPEVEYVD